MWRLLPVVQAASTLRGALRKGTARLAFRAPTRICGPKRQLSTTQEPPKNVMSNERLLFAFNIADVCIGLGVGLTLAWAAKFVFDWPEVCQIMVEQAEQHPLIEQELGLPLKASYFWSGSVSEERGVVTIPVTGPNRSGVLEGRAVLEQNGWRILLLQCVFPPSPQRISILDPSSARTWESVKPSSTPHPMARGGPPTNLPESNRQTTEPKPA